MIVCTFDFVDITLVFYSKRTGGLPRLPGLREDKKVKCNRLIKSASIPGPAGPLP